MQSAFGVQKGQSSETVWFTMLRLNVGVQLVPEKRMQTYDEMDTLAIALQLNGPLSNAKWIRDSSDMVMNFTSM